jgi:hypothetical protein
MGLALLIFILKSAALRTCNETWNHASPIRRLPTTA